MHVIKVVIACVIRECDTLLVYVPACYIGKVGS